MAKLLNKNKIQSFSSTGVISTTPDNLQDPIEKTVSKSNSVGSFSGIYFVFGAAPADGAELTITDDQGVAYTYRFLDDSDENGKLISGTIYEVHTGVDGFSASWNLHHAISLSSHAPIGKKFQTAANVLGVKGATAIWQNEEGEVGDKACTFNAAFDTACSTNPNSTFKDGATYSTTPVSSPKEVALTEITDRLYETSKFSREESILYHCARPWKIQAGWFTDGSERHRVGSVFAWGGDESAAVSLQQLSYYSTDAKAYGTATPHTKATAEIRITDSMAANDMIITSCPPDHNSLLGFRGVTSGSNGDVLDGSSTIAVKIETGGTAFSRASDFADNLKDAIEHANAFNGEMTVSIDVSSGTHADITLTNEESSWNSEVGNVPITYSGGSYLSLGNYDTTFSSGTSEFQNEKYMNLGALNTTLWKLPYFTVQDNTHIKKVYVKLFTDTSVHSDHQWVTFRVEVYGGLDIRSTGDVTSLYNGAGDTILGDALATPTNSQIKSSHKGAFMKLGVGDSQYSGAALLDGDAHHHEFDIPIDLTIEKKGTPIIVVFRSLDDDADIDLVTTPGISTIFGNVTIVGGVN